MNVTVIVEECACDVVDHRPGDEVAEIGDDVVRPEGAVFEDDVFGEVVWDDEGIDVCVKVFDGVDGGRVLEDRFVS